MESRVPPGSWHNQTQQQSSREFYRIKNKNLDGKTESRKKEAVKKKENYKKEKRAGKKRANRRKGGA